MSTTTTNGQTPPRNKKNRARRGDEAVPEGGAARRVPPHSNEAEESIIGAILVHPKIVFPQVRDRVRGEDFYHPALRSIYEAMVGLDRDGHPIDSVTVWDRMRAWDTHDRLRTFGGPDHLTRLMAGVVTVDNIGYHADIVTSRAALRRLQASFTEALALTWQDGVDATEMAATATRALEHYTSRQATVEGLEVVRACDVPDPGPTRWLVKDIWISSGVGFCAGEPKSKKSFLSAAIAISVASGQKLLNRFEVPQQGSVIMFNAEDKQSESRRRLERMCIAQGIRLDSLNIYFLKVNTLKLTDRAQMRALNATIAKIRPALCVVDPFRNLYDGDEDNSQHVMAALEPLRLLQRNHDTAVIVVHHMTKPNELKRRAGQRMRGSGALHGWGDSNLYVDLIGDVSAVEVEQRYADAPEPFGWQLRDQQTRDGLALWCEPCAIPSKKPQSEEQKKAGANSDEMLVLNTIRAGAGSPMSANTIETALGMNRKAVLDATKALSLAGVIEQVKYEALDKNNRKFTTTGWVERGARR